MKSWQPKFGETKVKEGQFYHIQKFSNCAKFLKSLTSFETKVATLDNSQLFSRFNVFKLKLDILHLALKLNKNHCQIQSSHDKIFQMSY